MCSSFNHQSVTIQPQANLDLGSLDFKQPIPDEKLEKSHYQHHDCDHCQTSSSEHHRCHNIRLRRFLLPAIFAFVALVIFLAWSCPNGKMPAWGIDLMGRAVLDSTTDSTSSNESPFVKHKLYLIAVFVGLLVVGIAGVVLAAWCCKGAFKNPCCCPCYLCACCGGLACLECLACGLCAEGISEI